MERGRKYDPFGTVGDRGTSNPKECFPVFNDFTIILLSLGFHGKLMKQNEKHILAVTGEDMLTVIDPVTENYQSIIRMSAERKVEMFGLLHEVGLRVYDADSEFDFAKTGTFFVTHEKNDFFAVGLKLIACSMVNHKYHIKLENLFGCILRRANFKPLANATPKKPLLDIREYANAQKPEIKKWILEVDTYLTDKGCKIVHGAGSGPFTYTKSRFFLNGEGVSHLSNVLFPHIFILKKLTYRV